MAIKKAVMNKIIKKMAEKQNKNTKLNAGQLREAASLFIKAIIDLSAEEKINLVGSVAK